MYNEQPNIGGAESAMPGTERAARYRPVKLIDVVGALSRALDLISPVVVNHHVRVGYVCARLAERLGLPEREACDLVVAGLVHDVGAFSLKVQLDTLAFEGDYGDHAETGYWLLRLNSRLDGPGRLVRRHHERWIEAREAPERIPQLTNCLFLADRVDASVRRGAALGGQAAGIAERIARGRGTLFNPLYLDALLDLTAEPGFWEEAAEPGRHLRGHIPAALEEERLDLTELLELSGLFSHVIDFRSRFTATHSKGVAYTAALMAEKAGFGEEATKLMFVAGNLHDLGKLAVPVGMLEKPAALSDEEFASVKRHALHSHHVLSGVPGLELVMEWAGSHHERIDGRGYPFQLTQERLSLGGRIMAVADVFTALTEDRPYRSGMDRDETGRVMEAMVAEGALDRDLVALLLEHFDECNSARVEAQAEALRDFESFFAGTGGVRR